MNNIDWTRAKKVGKPKAFKSAQHMWNLAVEYFKSVDDNPIIKKDFVKGGEMAGMSIDIPLHRPYTWAGFSAFLYLKGVIQKLDDYKQNTDNRYSEYSEVVHAIDTIMKAQKFEGAAAGIFATNIIARDLGLAEKTETSITVEQPLFPE